MERRYWSIQSHSWSISSRTRDEHFGDPVPSDLVSLLGVSLQKVGAQTLNASPDLLQQSNGNHLFLAFAIAGLVMANLKNFIPKFAKSKPTLSSVVAVAGLVIAAVMGSVYFGMNPVPYLLIAAIVGYLVFGNRKSTHKASRYLSRSFDPVVGPVATHVGARKATETCCRARLFRR